MAVKNLFLCLHAHCYQPPRENPWTQEIEREGSAAPFHDWNERIHYECYFPNARARVLDEKGKILDIVNNFEGISFNVGPTLMAWLEAHHPETYLYILRADEASRMLHHGHGHALAQIYNHVIMPLVSRRDKVTQVKWGVADFRRRFGRDPEATWLSETACDEETLEVLVEEGMKFLILEPHQAEAVRPLKGGAWLDVSKGEIDPKKPYRYFLKRDPSKFIDLFFYDGPISKDLGFADLAFDAKRFMDRIEGAAAKDFDGPQLVHVATDGETYGHHKPFGDRVLAYLWHVEAPKRGFTVVNYGEFLEKYSPQFEVKLQEGEDGLGTSWSCFHGVKRWKEHCGCRGEGPREWTQHWRRPLKETLDWLSGELAKIFEEKGSLYLHDVWAARNDYIHVILDRSPKNIEAFFIRHAKRPLRKEEITLCLKLFEIERNGMLMFTSCGWFFSEISGLETVQVLQFAARALELAAEVSPPSLEEEFLSRLSEAKSNLAEFRDGRGVYDRLVRPRRVSLERVAGFYAMASIFDETENPDRILDLYCFKVHVLTRRREAFGDLTMNFGRVRVISQLTFEEEDLIFIVIQIGLYDFRCSIKRYQDLTEFEKIEKELWGGLHSLHLVELLRKIDALFGQTYYSLKDLLLRERARIIAIITKEMVERISVVYENLYDENLRMNEIYRSMNLPIPPEIRYAVEHTLTKRLEGVLTSIAREGFLLKRATPVYRILEAAQSFGITLSREKIAQMVTSELTKRTEHLLSEMQLATLDECLAFEKLAKKMGLELNLRAAQDHLFDLVKRWRIHPESLPAISEEALHRLVQLAGAFDFNTDAFKKSIPNPEGARPLFAKKGPGPF